MTDFRALATELLAALAWVNKTQKIPDGFVDLEERAAKALAEPEEEKIPLLEFAAAPTPQAPPSPALPSPPRQLPPDASPLVRYQERMRQARERQSKIPGAHWY